MIENDQKRSFGDHEIKRLSGGLRKKFGGAKRPAQTALEDGCDEKKRFSIFHPRFGPYFSPFFGFFQKSQNKRFCFAIFSVKNALTKKMEYTMTKSTEKQKNSSLRFFIFETLSQRFLQNIFRNFQFFEKIKNDKFAVTYSNSLQSFFVRKQTHPKFDI